MNEKGQTFLMVLISGLVGLLFLAIFISIADPFIIIAFNALDATQTVTNIAAIKLILGLVPAIAVFMFVLNWMQQMANPGAGGGFP